MSEAPSYPVYIPKTFGQILDRVFRLMRANFKLFVGMAALPPAGFYALFALISVAILWPVLQALPKTPSPDEVIHLLVVGVPLMVVLTVAYLLVFAVYLGAASFAGVQADCGAKITIRQSYAVARSHAGRYALLLFLIYVFCFFPALIIQLAMFAGIGLTTLHKAQPNPAMVVLFPLLSVLQMAALIVGLIIGLRFALAFPASVSENLTAWQAIKRSGVLCRGAKGRILLVLLVIYAATYLAMLVLMGGAAMMGALGFLVFSGMHLQPSTPTIWGLGILGGVGFLAVMVLFMAASWAGYVTAFAVIYNDQRLRIDGASANAPGLGTSA
ncbi:MAG TPA: hypothetical protein VK574_20410 [Terracidiphilus sp.]|nr:hypothetical protein [Terracidiphilus sp.]